MDSDCQKPWYHSILRYFIAGAGMEILVPFFLFDFWPVCGSYAVILRYFPQHSEAIVCHDAAAVQGPF
jgi:hypothetical protein